MTVFSPTSRFSIHSYLPSSFLVTFYIRQHKKHSAATLGTLDQECDISDEEMSAKCEEYATKMEELKSIVGDFSMSKFEQMKALTSELSNIKITVESAPKKDTPEVRAAVQEALDAAKQATEEFGADSPEANVAWAEVEEVASTGLGNAMGARLDEECLVETAMDACAALEELNRAMEKAGIN